MRWREIKQKKQPSKQTQQAKVRYVKYTDRIKGFITDLFMIYTPILYIIAYVVLGGKDAFVTSGPAHFSGTALYGIIYAAFLAKTGQTPGKKAYDMKVVDIKTHEKISFFRALWRFVAFLFTATTLLGLFLPFFRQDKRALHDMLSNTIEINVSQN